MKIKSFIVIALVVLTIIAIACAPAPTPVPTAAPATKAPAPATSAPTTAAPAATSAPAAATTAPTAAPAAGKVTIRYAWWGSEARHKLTQQVVDLYKKSHPNVEFVVEFVSGPDFTPKLATQAATNQMPDLFQTDVSWISTYVDKGLIGDLQPYLDNGTIKTDKISKNVVAWGKGKDGKLYAFPLALNAGSMFYDPAVFAKAGYDSIPLDWTWQDFDRILTDVYKKTGVKASPLYYNITEVMAEVVARQTGKEMFSADGKSLGFGKSDIQPMFQRLLDLTNAGVYLPPDIWSTANTTENNPLVLGTASTAHGGSNQLVSYASTAKRKLAITSIPYSGKVQGTFARPSMMISILQSAPKNVKDAAADYINFFINDPEAAKILRDERGVPINSDNRDSIAAGSDENTQMIFKYIAHIEKNAAPPPAWAPAKASQVYSALADAYQAVAFKKLTPEQAADQFVTKANQILAAP